MKFFCVFLVCFLGSSVGAFNIKAFASQGNCLTMPGNSGTTGATFSVATCSAGNTYQQFTGAYVGDQLTMLLPFSSPQCNPTTVAVNTTVGTGNGAPIVATAYDPASKAQYWKRSTPPIGAQTGYLWYQNWATGRCMTMEGSGTSTYIDSYDCSAGAQNTHQMWLLSAGDQTLGNGNSVLKNQKTQVLDLLAPRCLNVKNSNPNPGATFDAQLCNGNAANYAQNFQVNVNQALTLTVDGSSQCVDGNTCCGPAPFQYPCTPTAPNHQWLPFVYTDAATGVYFMNIGTGLCVTWNPSNLNDVHTEACDRGNANQQWLMV